MSARLMWVTCVLCLMASGCIEGEPEETCERHAFEGTAYCLPTRSQGIHETGFRCADRPPGGWCPAELPACNDSAFGLFCSAAPVPPDEVDRIGAAIFGASAAPEPDAAAPEPDAVDPAVAADMDPPDEGADAIPDVDGEVPEDPEDPEDPLDREPFVPPGPDRGLYLELSWAVPAGLHPDQIADLDLRLRHPMAGDSFASGVGVCSYNNPDPRWSGEADSDGNPSLFLDETAGGVEVIRLLEPAPDTRYGVAVDAFDYTDPVTHDAPALPVEATLRIYLDGVLVIEWESSFAHSAERVHVADVVWCDEADPDCERVQLVEERPDWEY